MDQYGPLFETSADGPEPPRTWGVLELNRAIEAALQESFPGEIWLRGEIQGLSRTRMRKHWYFELVEKDPNSDQQAARVSVALLSWHRPKVDRNMRAAPGFELDDDVEVRIRCQVGYYPPWGKLQLAMTGVDPEFTLGKMAATRERTLRALAADGLIEKNAQLELPLIPQRIGLVTSVGSAAYNDFVHELAASNIGLNVMACDARVQGAETESSVVAAIRTLAAKGCDVVVVARGGGSRSDLAGFDSERIARAIAHCPVPVLTGIGHEIDTSLADVVAHTSLKTPTACAAFLVERVKESIERIEGAYTSIVGQAREYLDVQAEELVATSRQASSAAKVALRHRERDLMDHSKTLRRAARDSVRQERRRLRDRGRRVETSTQLRLAGRKARLDAALRGLAPERIERHLQRRAEQLERVPHRLIAMLPSRLERISERLDAVGHRVHALDPRRVLSRGYSLSYDATGSLVRSASELAEGESLRSVFVDGEVESKIQKIQINPERDDDSANVSKPRTRSKPK